MKKSTGKVAKSKSAPVVKKVAAKAVRKAVAVPAKRVTKVPAAKTVESKAPAAKAPAVKTTAAKLPPLVITSTVDVGFGNTLFLRGEGAGLNWDTGVALDCVDGVWTIELSATKPVTYKFLLNDVDWSTGADLVSAPGTKVSQTPAF